MASKLLTHANWRILKLFRENSNFIFERMVYATMINFSCKWKRN